MKAWTGPIDDHSFGLYITDKGRYLTIHGNSPGPAVRQNEGKAPALIIANDKAITFGLIEALRAAVDALEARTEYL